MPVFISTALGQMESGALRDEGALAPVLQVPEGCWLAEVDTQPFGLGNRVRAADARLGRLSCRGNAALRIYVSNQGHYSIQKAARLLGIGSENVQHVSAED